MIAQILMALIKANLAAGIVILPLLAMRGLVRPRFGAQAAYLMWLTPLAAGLAVLAPHPAARPLSASFVQDATAAVSEFVAAAPTSPGIGLDVSSIVFGGWIAGVIVAVALLLRRQAAFLVAMGALEPISDGVFRARRSDVGPAVVGVICPRIVTPADFETRFEVGEQELILAHERVHLRRGDATINAITCIVQCVCWFNPLVHLAARLLRIDQELACDAVVIDHFPAQRRTYAELLLKTQLASQPLPLGCHWPAGAQHPLKARIAMLKSPLPHRAMRMAGLAAVTTFILGAGATAWAAQPSGAPAGPGAAERAEALRQLALHPTYSCDPELERKGVGCKIIPMSYWIAVPTNEDVARYYPPGAREAGETARVHITCKSTPTGLLTACSVLDVHVTAPNGQAVPPESFAPAALQLSRYFQGREPSPPNPPPGIGSATFFIDFGDASQAASGGAPTPKSVAVSRLPVRYVAPAAAAETGPAPLIVQPVWIQKPTAADIARLYPVQALKLGLSSHAAMSCVIGSDGRLPHCDIGAVEVDGPAGAPTNMDMEFRTAMQELSKSFQMAPVSRDGVRVAPAEG